VGVHVFWTLLSAFALAIAVALFVQGVVEGWAVAGLILAGVGIAVTAGSLWAHVLVISRLRWKKESRCSSDDSRSPDPEAGRSHREQN